MILVKNWNFLFDCFLDKLGLEIMFADHPVRKKPSYTKKISRFYTVDIFGLFHRVNL